MSLPVKIVGRKGKAVDVAGSGHLVVGEHAFNETIAKNLSSINISFNFYKPKAQKQFIIKGIVAKANKDVSTSTDADLVIYEGTSAATTTVDKTLFQAAMTKHDSLILLPLNIIVNEGLFINAKTDDASIFITIMGYFIPKLT